jgi:hypothetical protein
MAPPDIQSPTSCTTPTASGPLAGADWYCDERLAAYGIDETAAPLRASARLLRRTARTPSTQAAPGWLVGPHTPPGAAAWSSKVGLVGARERCREQRAPVHVCARIGQEAVEDAIEDIAHPVAQCQYSARRLGSSGTSSKTPSMFAT